MSLNEKLDNNINIFISKDACNCVLLCNYFRGEGISFLAKSLLMFDQLLINQTIQPVDILFFASTRSFDFYVSQKEITTEIIACAGEATAMYVSSKGFNVSFYPQLSGLVRDSAAEFADWVGSRKVGFSISNLSKLSYSQFLSADQTVVIPTYHTIFDTAIIPNCYYYVFTSPSNVDAFLLTNTIPSTARIVSWGETTTSHLQALNYSVYHTLKISSDEALISFFEWELRLNKKRHPFECL